MDKDLSPIQSASVSLHSQTPHGRSAAPAQGEAWHILICGDFGFASQKPQRVHVSEWNDFFSQCRVRLSGTVPDNLSGIDKPLFVEYAVDSIRDFTAPSVERNAAVLVPFRDAIAALDDLLDGRIGVDRARALVEQTALPAQTKGALLSLLGKKPASAALPAPAAGSSRIDNLLAAVELPPVKGEANVPASVAAASGALFAAVTEGGAITIPRQELQQQRAALEAVVHRQAESIGRADFFMKRLASWSCLKQLVTAIGRTRGMTVSLFSGSRESLADSLAQALLDAGEQGLVPDIVLADHEYSFSNADIFRLETMSTAASDHHCMMVAAIDSHDALFEGIDARDTLAQFFDDIRFLPFKKLRSNPAARCLTLCGPQLSVGDEEPLGVTAAWGFLFAWVGDFLSGRSLFDCAWRRAASPVHLSCAVDIPLSLVEEAAAWGLTLFGTTEESGPVVTLVDEQAAGPAWSRFGYDLAVNRIMKLVAQKTVQAMDGGSTEELAETVKVFLVGQLEAYGLLSSADGVTVEVDDRNALAVAVDSEKTVCGFPLHIRLSV